MKHIGIVCEFNPFHAGHAYLLRQVRGADTVICLMSGNFTQRGEAAILPPVPRAAAAVAAGADLVLELPFPYSAASAEYFATAGVRALAAVGAGTLAFGSECGDTARLLAAAEKLLLPEFLPYYRQACKKRGSTGAVFDYLGEEFSSNDILGISYLRAIRKEALPLTALTVRRVGEGYHSADAGAAYPSAAALRAKLGASGGILPFLPAETREIFRAATERTGTADISRLGGAMLAVLRGYGMRKTPFPPTAEMDAGLFARLLSAAETATDYESLLRATACGAYTDGRIRRALLFLLAGVRREDLTAAPAFLRLLAANEKGLAFLSRTRKTRTVPVLTKKPAVERSGAAAHRARELDRISDGLYALCFPKPVTQKELQTAKPFVPRPAEG